jgi:hypothetical protein
LFAGGDFAGTGSLGELWADSAADRPAPIDLFDRTKALPAFSSAETIHQIEFRSGDDNAVPGPSGRDRLILPLAIVLLLGGVWRFLISAAYAKVYENLFGPLSDY